MERSGSQWLEQREAHHGWLTACLRSWREVVEHERVTKRRLVRRDGEQRPECALRLSTFESDATEQSAGAGKGNRNGKDQTCQTCQKKLRDDWFYQKARTGKFAGRTLRVADRLWWSRLRDQVRALGTWARVMRVKERNEVSRRARRRWQAALEYVRREIQKSNSETQRGGLETAEKEVSDVVNRWFSGRLAEEPMAKPAGSYNETRASGTDARESRNEKRFRRYGALE